MAGLARHRWKSRSPQSSNSARRRGDVKTAGFTHALLLGMGGSSLCPEVLRDDLRQDCRLPRAARARFDRSRRRFKAVEKPSRPGATRCSSFPASRAARSSPNLQAVFLRTREADRRRRRSGSRFIAITDPGSKMQQVAEARHFRHIFFGVPSIGGRYSALSNFGMVPGARHGSRRRRVPGTHRGDGRRPAGRRPGRRESRRRAGHRSSGRAAQHGRDKVTLIASPGISDLGAWLEQLIAESTGKHGKGIIPVDREAAGPPERLRQRSRLRLHAAGIRAGRRAGRRSRSAGAGRASGRAHHDRRHLRSRPGVFPLGDRHGGRRARSSASIRSISPTSKPARSRPAS